MKAQWYKETFTEALEMTYLQRAILAISIALVSLLIVLILRSVPKQAKEVAPVDATPLFDPVSAHDLATRLATGHPHRAMGTGGSKAAADWIAGEMERLELRTEIQEFTGWIEGSRVSGRNVIGIDFGVRKTALVVLAHYDIPFHVREGAMDDASGVGVLLELARVFSIEEQEKTLIFVASDGEEWGMLGARHFVQSYPELENIFAAVSLDYVRVELPERIYLRGEGQFKGYAPLWLWSLAEDCVTKVNGQAKAPSSLNHYLIRATNISSTDQGPFVRAGIPAINLGGNKTDSPLARSIYHTQLDTHENLKPEIFTVFGQAAELLIRSLDALADTPGDEGYFLPLRRESYIGRPALMSIQLLLFLPLLITTCFHYINIGKDERFLPRVMAEACNFVLFLMPWMLASALLYLLVRLNYIPRYELYPATPLDPFLYSPHWKAIAIAASVFVCCWVLVVFVRHALPPLREPDFAVSKAVDLDVLLTCSIIALLLNGFAATLFLAPAALLWIWMVQGRDPLRLSLNLMLFLGAAIPLILLVISVSGNLRLGWYVLWYLLLGVAYRFFSPAAVLIAVAAGTVGGRLLQQSIFSTKKADKSENEKNEVLEVQV
ncbi:MAG: Zn-dependent exopeptidase M28 [Candidatus Abyssobacteria bacterium SURF_5]|uniref:Zn-dependent exopeptidase M28 n=1 Tax=Abyssobacteria bacterium (strain SURF_5) TaxID=2093360 RepID=A0A3A4NWW1_ABYX5|nr:MAG: Zn-dependent exopeptidase M28 [Candidatus Abyssubacteria bacterium SURF_5]